MHRFFRLIPMSAGALVLAGQLGCALTPGSASVESQAASPATGTALVTAPAGIYTDTADGAADSSNDAQLKYTSLGLADDGFFHEFSNTFVSETRDGQPAGLFVYADDHDWGGYPVYYPYPYTLPVVPYGYVWSGSYGYWPCLYVPYGSSYSSSGGSVTAPVAISDGGVSSKRPGRGAGARANSGAVSRAGDGSGAYRPADHSQQEQSGEIMSSKGSGQTPSPYAAAQYRSHRGSRSSNGSYTGSGQQSSGQSSRARQRRMGGSNRGSVRPGLRWSSQRP
jgi:hypothetical protein